MCGLAGRLERDGRPVSRPLLAEMTRRLAHRGPDGSGFWFAGPLGLGHRRLAVIDRATSAQPLRTAGGELCLVANGEIFNYRSLRAALARRGHRFVTRGDCEVILHLYEEEGVGCLAHLRGMFAFALWDGRRRRLFLARDRLGEKPLYYAATPRAFSFASEVQALLPAPDIGRALDPLALDAFLALQYIPAPLSVYRSIRKLPAAHYLLFEGGRARLHRYWRPDFNRKNRSPFPDKAAQLRRVFDEAVAMRLESEVPLGAFLSGGLDSSAVVAVMSRLARRPLRTFTVGFGVRGFDELAAAGRVARFLRTDHHELVVRPALAADLPRLAACCGEPCGDPAALPSFFLAAHARRTVTVALSGDGGDELFGGYARYRQALLLERALPLLRPAASLVPGPAAAGASRLAWVVKTAPGLDQATRYRRWLTVFGEVERAALYGRGRRGPFYSGGTGSDWARPARHLDRMIAADLDCYLPDCLQYKSDTTSMAHGLEVRAPFLDHRLVAAAAALLPGDRIRPGASKYILRRLLAGRLPAGTLARGKHGFSVPLGAWFAGPGRDFVRATLLGRPAASRGWFAPGRVRELLAAHEAGARGLAGRLYLLLMLELWQRAHVD